MLNLYPNRRQYPAIVARAEAGFTLIELLVTLAVMIILISIAVPNFITFIQGNRLTSQANDLVTVLNYARSEAIKRGVRVTVCSSNDGASCLGSTTWDSGWIAFVDTNGDGVVGGEQVMQARGAIEAGNTLRTTITRITYQNSGFAGAPATFRLCDERGTAAGRPIVINFQGRVAVNASPTASCP